MPTVATTTRIETIDTLAKAYAQLRKVVSERVAALTAELLSVHKRRRSGILSAVAEAKAAQEALTAAVQDAPDLFVKPRTMTLHGVKVGYAKGAGRMEWEDEDTDLVARIEKVFAKEPELLALLVNTTKKPSKDGLQTLDAKQLARLGITIEGTGDVVIVKTTDGEVDKLVRKILKEGAVEEAEASS